MGSTCPLCHRTSARALESEAGLLAVLPSGPVFLSENQGSPGWCVLVYREHAEHVAELPLSDQQSLWRDVCRVAAAIRRVFPTSGKGGAPPRINYECLGNLVPHIHWHVIPRHADDPEPTKAVWGWSEDRLRGTMSAPERAALVAELRSALG